MFVDRLAADDVLYFDDAVGLLVFGGTELCSSFQGYIGQAVLYRHKIISADQVSLWVHEGSHQYTDPVAQ